MKSPELFAMALHNLWSRKSRTLLNTFGIVVSCVLLLLVLAGTRGAQQGLSELFENSDFARKFAILPGFEILPDAAPFKPELPGDMSSARRERITSQLKQQWKNTNRKRTRLDSARIKSLREIPELAYILPRYKHSCLAKLERKNQPPQSATLRAGAISKRDDEFGKRVFAGEQPNESNLKEIWIGEYRAWQLGFRSDSDLEELIGKEFTLRFERSDPKASAAAKKFARFFPRNQWNQVIAATDTFALLIQNAEQAGLDELEVQMVRDVAQKMGLSSAVKKNPAEPRESKGRYFERQYRIAGVFRPFEGFDLFSVSGTAIDADIMFHWQESESIQQEINKDRIYYSLVGSVASPRDLAAAIEKTEAAGFETRSALSVIQRANEELWKVRLAVSALAGVILLIASVGIMNTTIIGVMERTPEFGIMKAIGANDRDVRNLVMIESALTGILGVVLAVVLAQGIGYAASEIARGYLEERVRRSFDFAIFQYSRGQTGSRCRHEKPLTTYNSRSNSPNESNYPGLSWFQGCKFPARAPHMKGRPCNLESDFCFILSLPSRWLSFQPATPQPKQFLSIFRCGRPT